LENILEDLRCAIEAAAGGRQPRPERRFHKHSEYISYDISTAAFRRLLKEFRPRFRRLSLEERLEAAARLLAAHVGELGHAGIHLLGLSAPELTPDHFPYLDRIMEDFKSWSQVDGFCAGVLQPLLRRCPAETLFWLDRWSESANRFKRRSAVVPFTRKVGESGEFTGEALRLCARLAWDKEDIVRKGVGWALKDCLRAAPEPVKALVKDLRRRGAPATVTLYAVRDLRGTERDEILAVRKTC